MADLTSFTENNTACRPKRLDGIFGKHCCRCGTIDLNEITCFVRVVQQRSITRAGRILGIPKSTVSRKVASLEKRLKVTLLSRTTRSLSLTESGSFYFERMSKALAEIEAAEAGLQASRDRVEGLLRITGPVEFCTGTFMEVMRRFQEAYPDVQVELILTERVVDLIGEGLDLAIRIGELKDSTMISKKLGDICGQLVASADYLARFGTPMSPDDLAKHQLLGFAPNGLQLGWNLRKGPQRRSIKIPARLSTNNVLALRTAAMSHQGIAVLPHFLIRKELDEGSLRFVLTDWMAYGLPINIVFPGQRYVAPKLRALINFLSAELDFSRSTGAD